MQGLRIYIPAWGESTRAIVPASMEELTGVLFGLGADSGLTACPVEVGGTIRATLLNRPVPRLTEGERSEIINILNKAAMRDKVAVLDRYYTPANL